MILRGVGLDKLAALRRKIILGEKILDDEISQIWDTLSEIARLGSQTFLLCVQGVETAEMTQRENILEKLSRAGLVILEWKFTEHDAYCKARITDKGVRISHLG